MPLYAGATTIISAQLDDILRGVRVSLISVGVLTDSQLRQINFGRTKLGLPEVESTELVYLGRHHFESRSAQGYSCADMVQQLEWALSDHAVPFVVPRGTTLQSGVARPDGYGNMVRDQAVLDVTARKPRIEVFSVIPKGDRISPKTTKPL
jgi:hypothetical protein